MRTEMYRLFHIHKSIQGKRYPGTRSLAEALEVSERTIARDIEFLRDQMSAPVEYDRSRRGYFYSEDFAMPPVNLSEGEGLVLALGMGMLSALKGIGLENAFQGLSDKLPLLLGNRMSIELQQLGEEVSFAQESLRGDLEHLGRNLTVLQAAVHEKSRLEIAYYVPSRDEETSRRVDPYRLYWDQMWYLIAFCHLRQQRRTFALDRIRSITVLEEHFQIPRDFSLRKHLGNAWRFEKGDESFRVEIRFEPLVARYIRGRTFHPSQVEEELPDGRLVLRFQVAGLNEIKRWVLRFGSEAEVLEPEQLRNALWEEGKLLQRIYSH